MAEEREGGDRGGDVAAEGAAGGDEIGKGKLTRWWCRR
jgi:hypothetical protein